MGLVGTIITSVLAIAGTLFISLLARDLYACLPRLQRALIRFATCLLPIAEKEDRQEEWIANLEDLAPSELWRTWIALDCIRAALLIRIHKDDVIFFTIKRCIDILLSTMALLQMAPVFIFVAIAIRMSDGGPIFYRRRCIGRQAREFEVIRFRTLRLINHRDAPSLAHGELTSIGRFLKNTSIDELPQLINIWRGEMSLVGPRPVSVPLAKKIDKTIPNFEQRFEVKPGLTGYAQLNYRLAGSGNYMKDMHDLDLEYVKDHNIAKDILIILNTVKYLVTIQAA